VTVSDAPVPHVAENTQHAERVAAADAVVHPIDEPAPYITMDVQAPVPASVFSEGKYIKVEKDRARKVLVSDTSSVAEKKAARSRLKLIENAEKGVKREKELNEYSRRVTR